MTKFKLKRLAAALTAALFLNASMAWAAASPASPASPAAPAPTQGNPEAPAQESKVIWGLLLKLVAPIVFDYFSEWVKSKVKQKLDDPDFRKMLSDSANAAIVKVQRLMGSRDIVLVSPNAMQGEPETALKSDATGENYQGVNIALVEIGADGLPKGYRNVKDGFKTGERFKVRVLSTFDALVVLGNITPRGAQKQLYPAGGDNAVSVPAGKEILLPLGQDEYLQFVGDVGQDKLTFTVRDARSLESGKASGAQVFRKDESIGTHFVQEVKPGQYPVIAEAIGIEHLAH